MDKKIEGEKMEEKEGLTVEDVRKQTIITAEDIITQLENLIAHDATYPTLIGILIYYLKRSIDEMRLFRPKGMSSLSLKEIGLKKLYQVLEKIEKEETRAIKQYKEKQKEIH